MENLEVLSRIQFALNISFHILFPTITIALGWILLFFRVKNMLSKDERWMQLYRFWVKVFALTFALGVVSGVTMSFQFGTNWAGFMNTVGDVAGPLLAYEVMTAFFLEATFLGIMLFGEKRVSVTVHLLATLLVALGTTFSSFWILVLNSWMQTPSGVILENGRVVVTSWWDVIFNPSMPYRFLHMNIASVLTCAFLIAGVSAYQLRREKEIVKNPVSALGLKFGLSLGALFIPLQVLVGDLHGLNTLKYQPAKLAAMEGIWERQKGASAIVFGIPNEKTQTNDYEIGIPKLASFYLTHDWNGEVKGIKEFKEHPPVKPTFFAFRVMVGVGVLMWLISWYLSYKVRRQKELRPIEYKILIGMSFSGWVAVLSGWYVTEIGRQPWLVYGILKTKDALSAVPSQWVQISLIGYAVVYTMLLIAYIYTIFYLARKAGASHV